MLDAGFLGYKMALYVKPTIVLKGFLFLLYGDIADDLYTICFGLRIINLQLSNVH